MPHRPMNRLVRAAVLLMVLALIAFPLLGCGLVRNFTESLGKLFGGGGQETELETTSTETSPTVTTTPTPTEWSPSSAGPLVILTQRRGHPTRTAILDALRYYPGLGSEKGTLFVVLWLGVKGDWAMMQGRTEKNGTAVEALLQRNQDKEWKVLGFSKGGWKAVTAAGYPESPPEIFSGARAWPRETASSGGGGFRNLTNKRGNPTRTEILNTMRASQGWNINGKKIVYTVKWLGVQGNWAYCVATEYNTKMPMDVLLRYSSGSWRMVETQGEGDFPRTIREQYPNVPQAIFDGYR